MPLLGYFRRLFAHIAADFVNRRTAELKAAVERAETSERNMALAVASAGQAAWSYDFVAQEHRSDEAFRTLFGFAPNECVSPDDMLRRVHPHDRPKLIAEVYEAAPEVLVRPYDVQYRVLAPSQDGAPRERWVRSRGTVYRDASGALKKVAGVLQDVTDRKSLEYDREKFLLLAESSTDVIAFLSNDLVECYVNPAGRRLLRSEEAQKADSKLEGEDATNDIEPAALFRLIGSPTEQVLQRFENGHQRNVTLETLEGPCTLQVQVFVVQPDAAVDPIGLAIVGRDVSKEERYKEELEKAVRARDEFLAMVSHDLRNPMNVILGWVQILRNNNVSKEQLNRILSSLERNARLQDSLISDLLDVTRIINGKMMFRPARMRLTELLLHVCESARLTTAQKKIRLCARLPAEDIHLHADSERLQQVFWNLLSNAIKFTPEDGEICVEAKTCGNEVVVSVRDSGVGIDPVYLPHVFERFSQESASGSRKGGLGLGLSIVKGIVELHGGKVEAQSEGRDLGSTFIVTLPRREVSHASVSSLEGEHSMRTLQDEDFARGGSHAPGAASAARTAQGREGASDSEPALRVLVVEDSPDICELFTSLLELLGASVDTASTAREGLSKALAKDFDMLLCDLELPQEDGFWLVQKLREFERKLGGEAVRIVACSAKYAVNRSELASFGFHDFLPKPVSILDFERILAGCSRRAVPKRPLEGGTAAIESTPF
ncbi:MAG: response regulator [Silvanigrellales bacterium]|nr:response regulator [Silvanigrellales bacterium]